MPSVVAPAKIQGIRVEKAGLAPFERARRRHRCIGVVRGIESLRDRLRIGAEFGANRREHAVADIK
jgi:hypothetical protein